MFKREDIRQGQPGYYPKNERRYLYCNNFYAPEGFRCTRQEGHKGPHAAHTVMGIEGTTEEWLNPATNEKEIRVIPGMKNTEVVQIATWDYDNPPINPRRKV